MTVRVDIDDDDPTKIRIEAEWRYRDMVKSIPGVYPKKKGREVWNLHLSWVGCLALRGVFKEDLEIGDALRDWSLQYFTEKVLPAMELREALDAEGPDFLFPHQRADVQFLATVERGLLGNEPGTGKTRSSIRTMAELQKRGKNPFPALVIAPNSVKNSWKREAAAVWPGLDVIVVKGTATARRKQLATPAHVYVMNIEAIRGHSRLAGYGSISLNKCIPCGGQNGKVTPARCEVHPRELNVIDFQTVILDEAHRAKDPSTKQTRAVWAATGDAPFRIGMTGTPIADSPGDLWSVLHWLSPEEYPSKTKWVERMCNLMYSGYGGSIISGLLPSAKDEFYKGFDPRFRRMTKEVVLKHLPPVMMERRDVEMTPKQKKAYNDMANSLIAELDSGILAAPTKLTQVTRLLQFASSYGDIEVTPDPTDEDPDHVKTHLHLTGPSSKVDAFMEDLDDYAGDSVVVFAVSRQLIELLSAALTKADIRHGLITGAQTPDERTVHEKAFQEGKTKVILCTIAAGGTGITLTAARRAVFLQRPHSLIERKQALDRVHRIGSEIHESILITDYVTPDTIEETVLESLEGKGVRFEEIVRDQNLLRRALEGEHEVKEEEDE